MSKNKEFYISPDLDNDNLTETIECLNESAEKITLPVVKEIPLTIYLNKQEIVTAMTLGDMPDLLAVGYLLNQNMLKRDDIISEIDYDKELQIVVVRTNRKTNYEKKMEKKIRTSGCAVGTVYGDIMDDFSSINLDKKAKIIDLETLSYVKLSRQQLEQLEVAKLLKKKNYELSVYPIEEIEDYFFKRTHGYTNPVGFLY